MTARRSTGSLLVFAAPLLACCGPAGAPDADAAESRDVEWTHYGGDAGGSKYSPLDQIDRSNVARLEVAWTTRTGDFEGLSMEGSSSHSAEAAADPRASGGCTSCHGSSIRFETTPLMRDGTLYVSTPLNRVLALDPASGETRWAFDPHIDITRDYSEDLISRGVSAWNDPAARADAACARRVFLGTVDARLVAIDAATGLPCSGFGEGGSVRLDRGVEVNGRPVDAGDYLVTSPPAVLRDLVVVGSAIGDNRSRDVESGVVRAYHARTGVLRWSFDPIPRAPDHSAWGEWTPEAARTTGAANVWSIISVDEARDLVFLPTGSAAPDFYGGERPGRNDHANSLVALRGSTGEVVWSFQVVHHDLWDYDVAAQPLLVELRRDGGDVPAVVVGTKTGMLFVLHRETGEPLMPVEERPVPASDVPGERAWPTQPFPVRPALLHETRLTPDSAFGVDDETRAFCRAWIARLKNEGIFTPPSLEGTLVWPGFGGGINWDGMAWDPERQRVVTTVKRLAMFVQLHRRADFESGLANPLEGLEYARQGGTPYGMTRMPLVAPDGVPCTPPPWGRVTAVDVGNEGVVAWQRPLGVLPQLADVPAAAEWGSIVFGGPLVTAGGLVFVAASQDDRFRALDVDSGETLWEVELPAGGQAAPMTYRYRGRQYVVIAAGGRGGIGTAGDHIVAYALPAR
jgi:quinoprotein glucose dehydrogenase